jgi:glutamyl-tRNA synthetase
MEMTHVIRGDDHLNNTPRQINILKALGVEPPDYAHVPMILGEDGKRLSKRHGAVSVTQYRDEGYLPEALLNYLVRLGWSDGDREIFAVDELLERFDLRNVNHSAATFNPDKLRWLNEHYLRHSPETQVGQHLRWHLERLGIDPSVGPDAAAVVRAQRERVTTLVEMAEASRFLYEPLSDYDPTAAATHLNPDSAPLLEAAAQVLRGAESWEGAALFGRLKAMAKEHGVKVGRIGQPLRVALSGTAASPSIDALLELLGRERALERVTAAIRYARQPGDDASEAAKPPDKA